MLIPAQCIRPFENGISLQNRTFAALLLHRLGSWAQDSSNSLVKHALQIPLRKRRTFQVLVCPDLLCNDQGLVVRNWLHALLSQALKCSGILSQVELRTNEDDGDGGSMVINLGEPLCANVVEGGGRDDGEANQEDISLGI